MTIERISSPGDGPALDRQAFAHTMPTGSLDPDLALVQELWSRLGVEFKRKLIEVIQERIARQG